MERDKGQKSYNYLIYLASSQGYITFDEIMDCADKYSLPIQDFNWLCNAITSRGIIVYNEIPSSLLGADNDEYDDFAQSDYDAVYTRIIELSPSLEPFVNAVRNIISKRGLAKHAKFATTLVELAHQEPLHVQHLYR